ncbi:MAG TPA: glycine cleavage system protein GcvH [Actinomycetota bacterium]|nr:glycine cleavage system protein GcvH [Actinomycetota bacterium]
MALIPPDLRYTREHEWARLADGRVTVGITEFAQERLGDVVYLDLPTAGTEVTAGASMGEIESTKSVSDIFAPVTGTVAEINAECAENPAAVNQDPYGEGWLVAITPGDPSQYETLLTPEEYEAVVAGLVGE